MENNTKNKNFVASYILPKEKWFNIISYMDLKSFFSLEKSSKFFRKIFVEYYLEANTIREEIINFQNKINKIQTNSDKSFEKEKISFPDLFFKDIKKYKKNVLEKYINFLIQIPYNLVEFCGIYSNKSLKNLYDNDVIKTNDFKSEINEHFSCTSLTNYNENYKFYNYKNIVFINNTKFMSFYNNTLNVYETNENNIFTKKFCQYFDKKILFFDIIQNSINLIDNCGNFFSMNINDYSTNIKKIRFYIPEKIEQVFYIANHFIFLTENELFYNIEYESIFSSVKSDDLLLPEEQKILNEIFPNQEKSILKLFPTKIKRNYEKIIDIRSNNNNFLMFIDNNFDLFGLYHNEIDEIKEKEKEKKKRKNSANNQISNNNSFLNDNKKGLFFYKICKDVKFKNYYTMAFGENHWILLDQQFRLPLNDWTTEEVYKWFEQELGYEDYLKVIKYQNVTGKNIMEGDRKYFKDILGMSVNKIKQLCNKEIKKVEEGSIKGTSKFFGYGNNKFGQLGLIDIKYTKIPKKLEIPENEISNNNDFVVKIMCSNALSLLITRKGKIYACGNFNPKEKINKLGKEENEKEKEKEKGNKKRRNNNKKGKGKKKEKEEKKEENEDKNLWEEISYEIKRNYTNNFYVKLKDIYIQKNVIYIFGLKINKKDFI